MSKTTSQFHNGCAILSGVAVLENPRKENLKDPKPYFIFDAHFYMYDMPGSSVAGISLLRYYNSNPQQHFEEIGTYFVHVQVARMEETINGDLLTEDMTKCDYVMVGDIIEMIPANGVNPALRPFINISGVVHHVDQEHRIEISPQVYVQLLKDPTLPRALMPIRTFCPNTPRWSNKPKVSVGTYVSISGYLHSITRKPDGMVDRFEVELEKVTYLGKPSVPIATSTPPKGVSLPSGKRLRFSYGDSTPPAKKPRLSTPAATFSSPSPSLSSIALPSSPSPSSTTP
ncbi:hypothetical protein GG344DRAFT_75670 [Lentinula edodes]|nr:hypothetical protein GG344DRAFT_75670 [Lentinula edodes]